MTCTCFHEVGQHCQHCRAEHCLVSECECQEYEEMDVRKFQMWGRTV